MDAKNRKEIAAVRRHIVDQTDRSGSPDRNRPKGMTMTIDLESLKSLWDQSPSAEPLAVDRFAWLDDVFREKPDRRPDGWPPWCKYPTHRQGWKSIYGEHLICATCHPPVDERVVAEWQTI